MTKVFVSSVMDGFETERQAVRTVIESLDMKPIMAEDFSAMPRTPRQACLEGVRDSDVYFGILGARYGSKPDKGISVTEEEYNEAVRLGKPVLLLISRDEHEPEQQDFIKRVTGYNDGKFVNFYTSPTEINPLAVKALNRRVLQGNMEIGAENAARIIQDFMERLQPADRGETHLAAVMIPARFGTEYIPVLELEEPSLQKRFKQMALLGEPPLFSFDYATSTRDEADHLIIEQQDRRDEAVNLMETHPNGALAWRTRLPVADSSHKIMVLGQLIDENYIKERLQAFLTFAAVHCEWLNTRQPLDAVYCQIVLFNIGQHKIGPVPSSATGSFTMGWDAMDQNIPILSQPERLAIADIKDSQRISDKWLKLTLRIAKAKGFYYQHSKSFI